MSHVRTQIVDAVTTALTGLSTTGANAFKTRVYALARGKLPCLCIYRGREASTPLEMGHPRLMDRTFEVHVEIVAEGEDFDDVTDQIAVEVEVALAADFSLGGLCKEFYLAGSEPGPIGQGDHGEKRLGSLRLTYRATYHTTDADPATAA